MCGIAGIVNLSGEPVDSRLIRSMLTELKHRGPDDEGIFIHNNVGLGHVRLSILDLSKAGHQPMKSNDETHWIVFNGEIYNYLELKQELGFKYAFKTKTDTEVLLAAYLEWGEACLSRLNGDFAFVIYNQEQNILFGARDRFGIKPFYYQCDANRFVFASEIKALLPLNGKNVANEKIIFEYLVFNRTDQSEETFFQSVFKLQHGHCIRIENGVVSCRKWYDLQASLQYPTRLTPPEFRYELTRSVGLRLRSDVPVGVCLSGGIDSSSIASVLSQEYQLHGLKTFSAVYGRSDPADESRFIDCFKPIFRNMYAVTPSAEVFYSEFTDFIVSHSEPMPGVSPYAQYKVMQLAQGKVAVTLDGQGADEMLGGYNYFYGCYIKELLFNWRLLAAARESVGCYRNNPSKEAFLYLGYYLLPEFMKRRSGKGNSCISKNFHRRLSALSTLGSDLHNPSSVHDFCLKHFEFKLEHLLKWDDMNSMRFSIESRIPFLDHILVEKTLSVPSGQLLKNGTSKYLLREAMKGFLPAPIYSRKDKIGFATPADEWLRTTPFIDYVNELLNSESFNERGYFNVAECRRKHLRHINRETNAAKDIWKWINLEVWSRQFID